jgi:hypothetical protein
MPTGKEVAVIDMSEFAIMKYNKTEFQELIDANIPGMKISDADLDRIHMPTGGMTVWTVPGPGGEEMPKELIGVIVHSHTRRVFWGRAYGTDQGEPPTCSSRDGETGHPLDLDAARRENYGGVCFSCPKNDWNSSEKDESRAKACQERRFIYMLLPGSLLPSKIDISTANVRFSKKYLISLMNHGLKASQVITGIALTKTTSKTGFDYSQPVFRMIGPVPPTAIQAINDYVDTWVPMLKAAAQEAVVERDQEEAAD